MDLTDLVEDWLRSKPAVGWGVYRRATPDTICDYIFCRDHTYPMTEGDDYVIAIFEGYVVAFANPVITIQAGDPEFLNKLWAILKDHHTEFHV